MMPSGAPSLSFLGATGTVTGSKYLVEAWGSRLLIDCGLFQGKKPLRERNWRSLPFDLKSLDAVLLTHAHLDHTGYLPVLRKNGFTGPVYCTSGTAALARVLLPDSGYLQEEDARYANKKRFSKHKPAQPLYTQEDAEACLDALHPVPFNQPVLINERISVSFRPAGHILGAASIHIDLDGRTLVFSGDVGRFSDPVMNPPAPLGEPDYLVMESTYGNRLHDAVPPLSTLSDVVNRTIQRGGILMVPAFAVGRAQTLLHLLAGLRQDDAIADVPVFLNSPMAINATGIFCEHADEHRLSPDQCRAMCDLATYVNSAKQSRHLNTRDGPMIVISASGMATGGRILHHFKAWLGDPRNTVLFTGFQAAGTRGAAMVAGSKMVTVHGQQSVVKAEIAQLDSLSAHADADELIQWVAPLKDAPPRNLFITHGEASASAALKDRIYQDLGITAQLPVHGQRIELV